MVTKIGTSDSALTRYRLGATLIWLGVLTWAPFIVLRIAGEKPSLLLFLPFHLIGVIGGSRMRSLAHKDLGLARSKRDGWRRAGHTMILLGILVWSPYFYLKLFAHQQVDAMDFLPFHLTGVLAGIALLGLGYLVKRGEK